MPTEASPVVSNDYVEEIRGYLLGRLDFRHTSVSATPSRARFSQDRLADWWVFEGKRYRGIDGPLALHWRWVDHQIRRLLETHSPHWRPAAAPEGEVDWLATAHHSLATGMVEYVCRTSRLGLGQDEASALMGWRRWISTRWSAYVAEVEPPAGCPRELPWPGGGATPDLAQLKRWAFIARRSRWPILRSVVAESLRAVLEEQVIDQLPMPTQHERLFELVCVVRVLRSLAPAPRAIRWLGLRGDGNTIRVRGVECQLQRSIRREDMLATEQYGDGLRDAVERHGISVPQYIDALFVFDELREGFSGIILEAKSGEQAPSEAVHQLKCYRAAIGKELPGALVVWGVVEKPETVTWNPSSLDVNRDGRDYWLFSAARDIPETMRCVFSGSVWSREAHAQSSA